MVARLLDRIPFPESLRQLLRSMSERAANVHPAASVGVALVAAYLGVEVTLWLARQPLGYLWQFFGWVSGHDVRRLSFYDTLAQDVAFVVAVKIVYETRPRWRRS